MHYNDQQNLLNDWDREKINLMNRYFMSFSNGKIPHASITEVSTLASCTKCAYEYESTIQVNFLNSKNNMITKLTHTNYCILIETLYEQMLDLAGQHSRSLGYRWNPTKCAVLNAPSLTSSTSSNFRLSLYGVALPTVDEFTYLGMPFNKKGLFGPGILAKRSGGAVKTMALLNSVGVNRNGFSLLLCARLYTAFIRPKFEYGLAISRLSAADFKALDDLQNRLVGTEHYALNVKYCECCSLAEALIQMQLMPRTIKAPKTTVHFGLLDLFQKIETSTTV
jgi:hypothetical protein